MTNDELIREMRHWRKQAQISFTIQADLEARIAKAKRIIGDMMENSEMQCYADNRIVPCQAPCGRNFEYILSSVLAIQTALSNSKGIEEVKK